MPACCLPLLFYHTHLPRHFPMYYFMIRPRIGTPWNNNYRNKTHHKKYIIQSENVLTLGLFPSGYLRWYTPLSARNLGLPFSWILPGQLSATFRSSAYTRWNYSRYKSAKLLQTVSKQLIDKPCKVFGADIVLFSGSQETPKQYPGLLAGWTPVVCAQHDLP